MPRKAHSVTSSELGVIVESGAEDWQVFPRGPDGLATIRLKGRWVSPDRVRAVWVRLVDESSGAAVAPHLDMVQARHRPDGTWTAILRDVPTGGPYRLSSFLYNDKVWSPDYPIRGDHRHFLFVGDLWAIAGQSNAAGYGRGPIHDPPEIGVSMLRPDGRWSLAGHPLHGSLGTVDAPARHESQVWHSPWLHLAKLIRTKTCIPIGLIPAALGGSPLSRWEPSRPGGGDLFRSLRRMVRSTGGGVRGILWYQGESDADPETAATYLDRFAFAVADWRQTLNAPSLPVFTVQLNQCSGPSTDLGVLGWSMIREAQRQAARSIPEVYVVPSLDLPLGDQVHMTGATNLVIGERVARAVLDRVYGVPQSWRAPEIGRAVWRDRGHRIRLRFDHVDSRLRPNDALANPFRVDDARGQVPVTEVRYHETPDIDLLLARPAGREARVSGGWGRLPGPVPVDALRHLPMLGFHGVPVRKTVARTRPDVF